MPIDPSIPLSVRAPQIDSPVDVYGKVFQLQGMQQSLQNNQALEEERRQQIATRQRAEADNQTIDRLMAGAFKDDPETGVSTFDRPTFEQGLVKSGMGHLYPTLADHLDKLDQSAAKMAGERRTLIARSILAVQDAGNTPDAVKTAVAYLQKNGAITRDHVQPLLQSVAQDPSPENVASLMNRMGAALPEYRDLKNAEEKRKADLAKTTAETEKTQAEAAKLRSEAGGVPSGVEGFAIRAYAQKLGKAVADLTPDEKVQAMHFAKESNADPEMRALMISQKNLSNAMAQMQLNLMPTKEQAASVADDLVHHRIAPEQLASLFSTRGKEGLAFKLAVTAEAKKLDPTFNFEAASAEYGLVKSTGFQNTVRYMDSVVESIPRLKENATKLANGRFRTWNAILNAAKDQFNATDLKAMKVDALLVGDEVAKILQGGGTGSATSDAKLKQASEIFGTSDSVPAIATAINEVDALIGNRRRALTRGTYMEGTSAVPHSESKTPPPVPLTPGLKSVSGRK